MDGKVEIAGFSKRNVDTKSTVKFFVQKIKKKYPDYKIYATTAQLSAGILLTSVGFRRGSKIGDETFYFYD